MPSLNPSRRAAFGLLLALLSHAAPAAEPAVRIATWDRSSDPLTTVSEAVLQRAYQELGSWAQLKGLRVAYQRGILRVEQLLPAGAIRIEASSSHELFRLLARGGADVALSTEPGQAPPLRRGNGLRRLDVVLDEHALYHYLDHRHAELARSLATALRKLQASGELDSVRRQALRGYLQQAGTTSD